MNALRMDELSAEVEVLESKLKKTADLTTKISASLVKLSASAQQVEAAVKPIYSKTQTLTVLSNNIDEAIHAIDRVRQPSDAVSQEESAIRRGPQKVGLSEYLASLTRVNEGLMTLKKSNLRSTQKAVQQMTGLLKTGSLQLEELFRQTLAEDSKPVEPLHYITKQLPFPTFSSEKINTLAVLNDFLSSTLAASSGLQSNAAGVYAEVRGPYIASTLSSLALATVSTARRTNSTPYEKGTNAIGTYMNALEALFGAEWDNISQLFRSTEWSDILIRTTASAIGVFKNTSQELNTFIRQNMATDMFLAYDILDCVGPVSTRLKGKVGELPGFSDALKPIRQTATSSFSFILDDLKRTAQNIQVLPMDLTVADITTQTMARLRRISQYRSTVASLLVSLGDGNWKRSYNPQAVQTSFDVGADGNALLSHFILDVVDQLIHELEQRAATLIKKKSNIAVFMVNNVSYIETAIRRSDLSKILSRDALAKIDKWNKDAIKMYMEQWKECAAYLMDVTFTKSQVPGKSMSSKEKEGIKDKIKNFNMSFDELVQKHKGYNFPDKEVRMRLAKEIGFVAPLYGRFYDKYKDSISQKHLKYDRQSLEAILAQL